MSEEGDARVDSKRWHIGLGAALLLIMGLACEATEAAVDLSGQLVESSIQATALPPQAEAMLEQLQRPPGGAYTCSGSDTQGPYRPLLTVELQADGRLLVEPLDPIIPTAAEGTWTYSAELAQIGFSGQSVLDFGYYNALGDQLILELKPGAAAGMVPELGLICEPVG